MFAACISEQWRKLEGGGKLGKKTRDSKSKESRAKREDTGSMTPSKGEGLHFLVTWESELSWLLIEKSSFCMCVHSTSFRHHGKNIYIYFSALL